jgi:salicylate 5-hydroxylase small subunit
MTASKWRDGGGANASEVHNVARYIDEIARAPAGLELAGRSCVHDSEIVLNSLVYPT